MQVRKALDEAPYTCEEAVQLRLVDGSAYRYSTIEDGNPLTRTPRLNSPAIFMKSLVTVLRRDEVATQIETEAPKTRVPLAKYISTEVRSKTKAEVCCTSHLSCVLYHKAASLLLLEVLAGFWPRVEGSALSKHARSDLLREGQAVDTSASESNTLHMISKCM